VERIAVSVGASRDGHTDVLSGISPGELVVLEPVEGLAEGAPVKLKGG
jgi:hypothetical protein